MVPQCFSDPLTFARLMNHSCEVLKDDVILEKRTCVLRNRVKEPSKRRPRFAVQRVRMRRRDDIRTHMMDARMNRERGNIHEDQVRSADLTEMHAEWIHPEMIGLFRISCRNMPGHAFIETKLGKETEG